MANRKGATRININIPDTTLAKVDDYAQRMGVNRTSAILVLMNIALDSQKAVNDLDELLKLYNDKKSIDKNA